MLQKTLLNAMTYTVERTYNGQTVTSTEELSPMVATFIFMAVILAFVLVIAYLVGLYKMAKKMGHRYPWWAFIPVLNIVMLLQLADISPWLVLLAFVPVLNLLLMVVIAVAYYKISEKAGADPMIGLLIALVITIYWPFYILKHLDKNNQTNQVVANSGVAN